jgi:UDP-N-acetylmuramate dehydrogenase
MTGAANPPLDRAALAGDIARRVGVKAERDAPLGRFTTMRVGGPADLLATAHNAFELRALVRFARTHELPLLLLGRGSNVVISDRGVRGLVVHVKAEGSRVEGGRYIAEAGVPMARAATETQRSGLTGLEFGLAIPGCVGGAIWANAGAHGADVASVLEWADVLLANNREARLPVVDLGLAYRDSRFKRGAEGDGPGGGPAEVVIQAAFRLRPAVPEAIAGELDEIRRWRRDHQPLGIPSAGSAFRNPTEGPSAGELIDRAGLKGFRIGGAAVSEKHANFIVNDRKGTAADVRRVADHVRTTIRDRDGFELVPEIEFVGDWVGWPWTADPEAAG